jgi:hypothetical protein
MPDAGCRMPDALDRTLAQRFAVTSRTGAHARSADRPAEDRCDDTDPRVVTLRLGRAFASRESFHTAKVAMTIPWDRI